jgi:hypothetical protein
MLSFHEFSKQEFAISIIEGMRGSMKVWDSGFEISVSGNSNWTKRVKWPGVRRVSNPGHSPTIWKIEMRRLTRMQMEEKSGREGMIAIRSCMREDLSSGENEANELLR